MRPLAFLLCVAAHAHAQPCGPDGCPLPAASPLRWVQTASDPRRIYLYQGATQLGGYDLDGHYYRPLVGDAWGDKCEPPIPAPCFGVAADRLADKPRYSLNGRLVDPAQAHEAVGAGLADDSGKLRVTILGSDEKRRQVRQDLDRDPAFAPQRDRFAVRDYPADHWSTRPGFVAPGDPTIYCQAPDGRVLHRQDDYRGGAPSLAAALRQARNDYDPKKDPDLRAPASAPDPQRLGSLALALAFGVGLFAFLRRTPFLPKGT